ncbi:DUF3284 domain-containing protein [Streptococcus moroccensis]|uniref:DUF3284 domain-containing protein n=1 Tax=Streptococcus moroccensis TaxID=1451356 RepID=A0ABT9YSD9_9STRE|nr:DUF3284 domain-containing protein [Streptococcus moroccensis]MDQ0222812.1 hypothetical protein [Streptococcus moroccensis]
MEVQGRYHVDRQKLFTFLLDQFREDCRQNTGKELALSDIQPGFSFIKSFGKNQSNQVKVTVLELESPRLYKVQLKSNRGESLVVYEMEEQGAETQVTYREEMEADGRLQGLNYKLLYPFLKKRMQKQMKSRLDYLISHLKAKP